MYFCYYLFMRLYGSKIGWVAAVLLLNANASFALPDCPKTDFPHNCFDKYTWDDGTKYVGDWQDATFNGQGTLTYSNGDRYVGEWRNGKKHGKGCEVGFVKQFSSCIVVVSDFALSLIHI